MATHLGERQLRLERSFTKLLTDQNFIFIERCLAVTLLPSFRETVLVDVVTVLAGMQILCFAGLKMEKINYPHNHPALFAASCGLIIRLVSYQIGPQTCSKSFTATCVGLGLLPFILIFVSLDKIQGMKQEQETRPTQAPCLNTDLVQQHNYDVPPRASSAPSSFSQWETRDQPIGGGGFPFGHVASHTVTGALSAVKKPKDLDNLDNTSSLIKGLVLEQDISSTEATSLNIDKLVDQQNYDVACSISSTSKFSQCKTGDTTGAIEFGAVSSLNTVLVRQHNSDAANSVSCTSNFSQWEIRDPPIGAGGFTFVHVASHKVTRDLCAVKKLKDPDNLVHTSSLNKEIQILSQLEHPNIVKYYGTERVGNHTWLFMEYVETGTLTKYISEAGAFRERLVRDTTAQILSALAYLHNKGVVHRDIKPDNILVDSYGFVKLIDFGSAKHVNESMGRHSTWGTSHYAAPETLEEKEYSSSDEAHSADIWSLGCVIIEMFTGQRPWHGLHWLQVNREVCWNKRDPEIPQNLSTEGQEFLQLCFERNPAKRLSASELLQHSFVS